MGNAVPIAIEAKPEIFLNRGFGRVAVVVRNDRQRTQCFGFEAIHRTFAGLAVRASIGDFVQPLPYLPVHVVQIGELA